MSVFVPLEYYTIAQENYVLDHRRRQMEYGKDLQAQIDEKRGREEKLKLKDKADAERKQQGKFYSNVDF